MDRQRRRNSRIRLLLALPLITLALAGDPGSAAPTRRAKKPPTVAVPGELLVGFRAGVSAAEQTRVLAKVGAAKKRGFKKIGGALVALDEDAVERALPQLRADPNVRYAEPNFVVHAIGAPNDPFYGQLWGLSNVGQPVNGWPGTPDADIDAEEAWSVTTGSRSVVVAVIDTGVDASHPDLSAAMWVNPGEDCVGCRSDGVDNDANGYVDDWRGWDFANDDNDPMDDHGHGTHVAGTIGAVGNNGVGVAGVSWNVRLMPIKFLSAAGSGTTADAVSAVLYAAEQGAAVMNNSWSGDEFSQALLDAIEVADERGSLFVAAAGNDGLDTDLLPAYPSSYETPNVLSVAATDNDDQRALFSNAGRRSVDLGAPGVDVYSTWPGGSYRYASGTSMAAPHVAGAASLVKSAFPAASDVGLKTLLLRSVDPNASLAGVTATEGRLNVATAVACSAAPKVWLESPAPGFQVDVGQPVTVTAGATNCADPAGVQVSASANGAPIELTARGDGLYSATFTPAARGPVDVTVTGAVGAATETRTVSGVASQVYPIVPGGPAVTVTTTIPGENARSSFDGQAGQRVSLRLSGVTIASSLVSILEPDGSSLGSSQFVGTSGGFLDVRTLPVGGRYLILVDPQGSATGSMTLTLYDVPPDAAGTIAAGGPAVTAATITPGQNARLSFDGQAGQRVSLRLSGVTIASSYVSILAPGGGAVGGKVLVGASGGFADARTLPTSGTYTVFVDPQIANTGSITATLYDVPPDATGTLAPGGPAVTATTTVPGQNARLSFDGRAGQRVSLKLSSVTIPGSYVSLLAPDGSIVGGKILVGTSGGFLDTRTLAVNGGYTVFVDPQVANTGSITLTLYDVPPDVTGTIAPGGSSVTITATTPGQNARLSFDGRASRQVSLSLSSVTIASSYVSIAKPDGTPLTGNVLVGSGGGFVDTRTLPADGTYTIAVDPPGANAGSMTLTLYDVPPDVTGTLAVGGPSLTVRTAVPGQNARVTFDGRTGQRINLRLSAVTVSASYVSVERPDGSTLVAPTYVGVTGRTILVDLLTDGTYAIRIDPRGAATGSMTLTLTESA